MDLSCSQVRASPTITQIQIDLIFCFVFHDRIRWERYDRRLRWAIISCIVFTSSWWIWLVVQIIRWEHCSKWSWYHYSTRSPSRCSILQSWRKSFYYQDASGEFSKFDAGNQVEHLLSHLREAWIRIHGVDSYPNYQIVYQPAMFMKER